MTKFNKLFTFKIKHTRFSTIFIVREGNHHMYKINFKQPIHVHFIGIGGISMSGLAEILLKEGFTVSGSDSKVSPLTEHLEAKGAQSFLWSESIQYHRRDRLRRIHCRDPQRKCRADGSCCQKNPNADPCGAAWTADG